MNTISRQKAREIGWKSFLCGVMIDKNPHLQGSDLYIAWQNGWIRASKGYNKPQPEFKDNG
ncbi:hypothetical protein LG288_05870 [Idiomarina seosinensis]|uniref:hypothetical protein n=1 Tax=Idiomarina seosinensis TaxID=281739 RepID=UPI00384CFFDB